MFFVVLQAELGTLVFGCGSRLLLVYMAFSITLYRTHIENYARPTIDINIRLQSGTIIPNRRVPRIKVVQRDPLCIRKVPAPFSGLYEV
jgi:hypothetical protein